jgi:hypothetical protein
VVDKAVPSEPNWAYQPGNPGPLCVNHMVSCFLEGMEKNAHTQVNYDRIREITQGAEENRFFLWLASRRPLLNILV